MINQKSSSKIFGFSKTKPLARNAFRHRRKRWVGVLVICLFVFPCTSCFAKFTMTPEQKITFSQALQQQNENSGLSPYTSQKLDKIIQNYENSSQFSSFDAALKAVNDNSAAERLVNSANVGAYAARSQGENWAVSTFFAPIIAALYVIATFLKYFVGFAGNVLDLTLNPALYNFTGSKMITVGWSAVRDVCNLFFLLALLFIAFCTILQIPKYHARKTLLTLIIMALLINFSKPIAVFIFDGSQLLMNFFLSKMSAGGNQNPSIMYNRATQIADILYNNVQTYAGSESSINLAVQYLFAIVFLFMLMVAYIVIGIFLLIRIVAIMLLIIVSPFAFFASIIPDFKKMSSSWWDALFKYSYFGPAAAFFLYLATGLAQYLPEITKQAGVGASLDILTKNFLHYSLVIVFLYASIIMANKFSLQFSQAIINRANKIMKYGTGLAGLQWSGRKLWEGAKYTGRAAARVTDYKVLAPLGVSPRALWRGWKKGAEEAEREAMEPAEVAARDRWNKLLGRKKPPDYHKNVQFESDVDKYMKEQRTISTEDKALIGVIEKLKDDKSPEARKRVAAALRLMFENNDQNEFMKQYALIDKDFKELGLKSNNPEDLRKALEFILGRAGMDKDQTGRQLHQLGTIALGKGNLANFGMASFNATTGKYEINDGRDEKHQQLTFSRARARNIDVQEKMRRMHWNAILEENADGSSGGIHQTGMALLSDMKQAEISQLNRARSDFIERMYGSRQKIRDFAAANKELSDEQRKNLDSFVKRIEIEFRGTTEKKRGGEGKQTAYDREYYNL